MSSPLFCLPGWCLGRGPLISTVNALNGQFLDLPGYGDRPLIDDFDAAVDALAGELPPQASLMGWSLGAQFALAIAARHPGKVGRLALISATPAFVQRPGWLHALPPATLDAFLLATAEDAQAIRKRFVTIFCQGDARARECAKDILAQADALPATPALLAGLTWLADNDLRDELSALPMPVLLLHGRQDPLMPAGAAQALADQLADVQLHWIDTAAHAPFISQPDACRARLDRFFHDTSNQPA